MALTYKDIAGISNADFWKLARAKNPSFASHTAEKTADVFTERGFEALTRNDIGAINEYFEISMRVAFQKVDVSNARNPLADIGLIEVYDTPNGGYTQRIAVHSIKPISPAYKGLQDGVSVDPFVIQKPNVDERFFTQNFDYQSMITIQDFQVKTIFLDEYGMGQFIAGIMEGLANGYTVQEYVNVKEAINVALNSSTFALKDSQKLSVSSFNFDAPTKDSLEDLILQIKDLASAMDSQAQTGMYNANGFETYVPTDDYVCLLRSGIKNRIELELEVGAFNPDRLALPFEVREISDFGGLVPYQDAAFTTKLYPEYNSLGQRVAYNTAADGEGTTVADDNVYWKDENAEVIGVIFQKGAIFENKQNPYSVRPIYNPRGLYTNYWASSPNNAINVDPNYNMIVITTSAQS